MLDDLAAAHVSNTVVQSAWVPTVRAQFNLVNQKPAQALELLESVKPYERGQLIGNLSYACMIPAYLRGEAYLATKQGGLALAEFQKLRDNRGIVGNCWSGALGLLGQARAQALSGSTNAARNSYQRFFQLKDCPSGIRQVEIEERGRDRHSWGAVRGCWRSVPFNERIARQFRSEVTRDGVQQPSRRPDVARCSHAKWRREGAHSDHSRRRDRG